MDRHAARPPPRRSQARIARSSFGERGVVDALDRSTPNASSSIASASPRACRAPADRTSARDRARRPSRRGRRRRRRRRFRVPACCSSAPSATAGSPAIFMRAVGLLRARLDDHLALIDAGRLVGDDVAEEFAALAVRRGVATSSVVSAWRAPVEQRRGRRARSSRCSPGSRAKICRRASAPPATSANESNSRLAPVSTIWLSTCSAGASSTETHARPWRPRRGQTTRARAAARPAPRRA